MNSNLTNEQLCDIRDMLMSHPSFDNYGEHHELLPDLLFCIQPGGDDPGWYLSDSKRMFYSHRHCQEVEAYLVNAMLSNLPNHTAFCSLHNGEKSVYQVIQNVPPKHSQYTGTPRLYAIKPSPLEALADFWSNY